MKAEKDKKTEKWLIQYRYTDWQGKRRKSTKRGFATKREAEEWLRNFLITQKADFDMKFEDFWKMYCADMETRLREHTMRTKKYIVELKILPYFGNKRVNDITADDIRQWQNGLIKMGDSHTYLKTINNQLSAIFNYAVRYYDLKSNPCAKAGSMSKSKAEEMDFWTGEEFRKFINSVMNKRLSYMAFMTLYWTGMRMGELLALNPKDVDLEKRTISITKSYQRLGKKDVITPPKTPKSKRVITIPEFLAADIKDYMLFFADVFSFEEIHSEIEKILITDDLVENWTYAAFGDAYIDSVAKEIQEAFPGIKGFNRRGLYRMKKFYETYCDDEFVTTLLTQISWSNHLAIMSKAKTAEERHFYMALCIKEAYSARELDRQINSGYYERCGSGRIRRHRRKNRHQNRRQRQVC